MLKPLPQEGHESKRNIASTRSSLRGPIMRSIKSTEKKSKRHKKAPPQALQIEVTIQNLQNSDSPILAKASQQLMDFIKKAQNVTMSELNDLIHNLQRTVLSLQKKRIKSVREQLRRKKK